jgi:hypothetical protein
MNYHQWLEGDDVVIRNIDVIRTIISYFEIVYIMSALGVFLSEE